MDCKKRNHNGNVIQKQTLIHDYNQYKGAVDKNDQVIGYYTSVRKCRTWTTKAVFHLFEEAFYNSFLIYKQQINPTLKFCDFKLPIIEDMITYDKDTVNPQIPPKQVVTFLNYWL